MKGCGDPKKGATVPFGPASTRCRGSTWLEGTERGGNGTEGWGIAGCRSSTRLEGTESVPPGRQSASCRRCRGSTLLEETERSCWPVRSIIACSLQRRARLCRVNSYLAQLVGHFLAHWL